MITFDEARAFVLAGCARNATELLGLNEARGSVTAQEVVAAEQVPPFANTAVDGYAVLAADIASVPTTLQVTGTVRAGMSGADSPVAPGCAVRIMTGAPVPPGADAIVMVEDTEGSPTGDTVVVTATATVGQHIRPAGDDVNPEDPVIGFGTELTAAHLGVHVDRLGIDLLTFTAHKLYGPRGAGALYVRSGTPLQGQIIGGGQERGIRAGTDRYGNTA